MRASQVRGQSGPYPFGSGRSLAGRGKGGDAAASPTPAFSRPPSAVAQTGLRRLQTPPQLPTGLMPDFQYDRAHVIDYVYVGDRLQVRGEARVGPLSGDGPAYDGRGPYGAAPADGSDHRWIQFDMALALPSTGRPAAGATAQTLTVLQWNVLARLWTEWNGAAHGMPEHESPAQTRQRHKVCALVCLGQECLSMAEGKGVVCDG